MELRTLRYFLAVAQAKTISAAAEALHVTQPTLSRQMLELDGGALLIDTPGMRELAMWDAVDGVEDVFDEVAEAAARCRFRDCTHTHEPGCAVRAGVESGELDPGRVANYLKLHEEADRTAMLARKRARMKEISKFNHTNRRD